MISLSKRTFIFGLVGWTNWDTMSKILNTFKALLGQKPQYHLLASVDYSPFYLRRGIQLEANVHLYRGIWKFKKGVLIDALSGECPESADFFRYT